MINFTKYQGLGNDFIILDSNEEKQLKDYEIESKLIKKLCNRNFGIGADGIIIARPSKIADIRMSIYNSDGTEAEMCGNGIRCLTKLLYDNKKIHIGQELTVETIAGLISAKLIDKSNIKVNMGKPILEPNQIPTTFILGKDKLPELSIDINGHSYRALAVGMGNPHMIIPVKSLSEVCIENVGYELEHNKYFPEKTNVHIVQIMSSHLIKALVWERGAGPTNACGTGACAILVACYLTGLTSNHATITLPGGNLEIFWKGFNNEIFMTGNAERVFSGSFNDKNDD